MIFGHDQNTLLLRAEVERMRRENASLRELAERAAGNARSLSAADDENERLRDEVVRAKEAQLQAMRSGLTLLNATFVAALGCMWGYFWLAMSDAPGWQWAALAPPLLFCAVVLKSVQMPRPLAVTKRTEGAS